MAAIHNRRRHVLAISTILSTQLFLYKSRGDSPTPFCYFFRSSTVYEFTAISTTLGSHVDYIVGTLNNIEVVLNHYHSVAFIHQSIYHTEQHLHIFEVQTCGWFIEDINCFAGISLCLFGCQLHSLALASRKCARRLSEFHIAKSHILQNFYLREN